MKKDFSVLFLSAVAFLTSCESEEFAVSDLCKGYWLSYDEVTCPFCGTDIIGVWGNVWNFHENGDVLSWDFSYVYGMMGSTYETRCYQYAATSSTLTISLPSGKTDEWTGTWRVSRNPEEENSYVWTKDTITLHLHYSEINPIARENSWYLPPNTTFSVDKDWRCRADKWTPISEEEFKAFVEGSSWQYLSATGIDDKGSLSDSKNYWEGWERGNGEDSPAVYTFSSDGYLTINSKNIQRNETFYKKHGKYTYKPDDGNSVWLDGEKQPHLQILKMDDEFLDFDRLCFIEYLGWSPRHQMYKYAYSIYARKDENSWK